jgi:hypothetical protein
LLDGETIDPMKNLFERRGIRLAVPARAGGDAKLLDDLERLLPLEPLDYPTKRGG